MIEFMKNFKNDESGAITVDWVVLTAAVTGLAVIAYALIQGGTESLADDVEAALSDSAISISTGDSNTAVGGIITGGSSGSGSGGN
ncbi:hypothetical protein [Ruegeria arenilitoris]|uniref:hypothetical protein n=1 Tax=Ruegeria arenilitoris TaxID=1173585 RepID=UPI00147D4C3F|nr:hypothetical protein [Ruegeria arenilitoris]